MTKQNAPTDFVAQMSNEKRNKSMIIITNPVDMDQRVRHFNFVSPSAI